MKLSWKDLVTTLFVTLGGSVVYAKFYDYSWAGIGSWRSAVAALAVVGVGMFAFSRFKFDNFSWLNSGEMLLGLVAIVLAFSGMISTSEVIFYTLAATLGVFWLTDTARKIRHSLIDHENTTLGHHLTAH
jgi:hypothetical protein